MWAQRCALLLAKRPTVCWIARHEPRFIAQPRPTGEAWQLPGRPSGVTRHAVEPDGLGHLGRLV